MKFITKATPNAKISPVCPPNAPPTARNKPLIAASNTAVFSPLIVLIHSCQSIMTRRPIMKLMTMIRIVAFALLVGAAGTVFAGQTQGSAQGPKPFPTAGAPQTPPAAPASESPTAMPLYPAAQFLEVIDAGKGQQFHLYGTDAPVADIVAYYRTTLKNGGRVLFQAPLMHQFDLGRYDEA